MINKESITMELLDFFFKKGLDISKKDIIFIESKEESLFDIRIKIGTKKIKLED